MCWGPLAWAILFLPYTFPLTGGGLLMVTYPHPLMSFTFCGSFQCLSYCQEVLLDIEPNSFPLLPKATSSPWIAAFTVNLLKVFEIHDLPNAMASPEHSSVLLLSGLQTEQNLLGSRSGQGFREQNCNLEKNIK